MTPSLALEELIRSSPSLAAPLAGAARAAASEAPILVVGEPGTGRSTVARALHGASRRAGAPLEEVDAGAIPSSLFESELFGFRAGAFTGAEQGSPGRVGRADGGSLLLDHVEEIPIASQAKLLRLLAERRYAPLGADERAADVRFLAVAADDLRERVRRGAFRSDLYYRMEVVAFRLPALRERIGDLEVLSAAVLADLAERFGRGPLALAPRALTWMRRHRWPGNLRELRNCLERALVLGDGSEIDPAPPAGLEAIPRPLAEVEAEQLRRALAYTRGHQGRAAELLGISRKALWAKRRRLGIP